MISNNEMKLYGKWMCKVLLVLFLSFIVLIIFINCQDFSQLDIKNSDRRKIEDKYSDKAMNTENSKSYLYQQNQKLKGIRENLKSKKKVMDVSGIKKNIKDYKKKKNQNKK